ncbi:MAG: peptidoglycan-binding protein [Bacillota bacterium]
MNKNKIIGPLLFTMIATTFAIFTILPNPCEASEVYPLYDNDYSDLCNDLERVIYPTDPPMQGADVAELQELLCKQGYYTGTRDGIYGQSTVESIKRLQADNGIKADGWVNYQTWQVLAKDKEPNNISAAPTKPTGYLHIEIIISERKLILYNDGKVFKEYPVALGKPSTPTPVGEWKIASKGIWGGGFGTRWMGLNVPWGKYGIHGTNKPGSIGAYASGGCIRMYNRNVEELFSWVPVGTTVIIVGSFPKLSYHTIRPGTASRDALHVQRSLREQGLYWGPIDGRYGKMSEMSVIYFQLINNIEGEGIINKETYEKLGL